MSRMLCTLLMLLVWFSPAHAAEPPTCDSTCLQQRAIALLSAGQDAQGVLAQLRAIPTQIEPKNTTHTNHDDGAALALAIQQTRTALRQRAKALAWTKNEAQNLAALFDQLQSQRLLYELKFTRVEQTLKQFQAHRALTRLAQQRTAINTRWSKLDARIATLQSLTREVSNTAMPQPLPEGAQSAMLLLELALAELQPHDATDNPALYGLQTLPNQRPGLIAPPLPQAPGITPSYATGDQPPVPLAADLAPAGEVELSEAIRAKAAALANDPVQLFDFVRSQIQTEFYPGARKSAEQVLSSGRGNDLDQATLLIALLRASRTPARYVHGVIDLPAAELAQLLGVPETRIGRALHASGTAHEPLVVAGQITRWRIAHTWVSTWVPYGNYRGNPVDASAPVWLPLAPALKHYAQSPGTGVLGRAGIIGREWVRNWLGQVPATPEDTQLPLDALRAQVQQWLASQPPPQPDYAAQLASRSLDTPPLQLLPASMPYPVHLVSAEVAVLDDAHRQHLTIKLRAGPNAADALVLELKAPMSHWLQRRISLAYAPATVDDTILLNLRGSFADVPAWLIKLRAQILIDGQPQRSSETEIQPGQRQRLELLLDSPAGNVTLEQQLSAGTLHQLRVGEVGDLDAAANGALEADSETPAASLLSAFGQAYLHAVERDASELARLTGVREIAPFPTLALVLPQVKAQQLQGLTERMEFQGVALDAALRQVEAIALTTSGDTEASKAESDYHALTGLQASALEADNFSRQWSVSATSADRLLRQARRQNIEVIDLAPGQAANTAGLAHSPAIIEILQGWLNRGYHIRIPRQTLVADSWTGSGFVVHRADTGEAGYFISGGYAGGISTPVPSQWTLQQLVSSLGNPFGQPPNLDPSQTSILVIDEQTDRQVGLVGEALQQPLAVYAIDFQGRSVAGLNLKFTIKAGTASLQNGSSDAIAITDLSGRASMPVVLGQKLGPLGVDVIPDVEDAKPEFQGLNLIGISAQVDGLTLLTGRDMVAFVRAGPPERLEAEWLYQQIIDDAGSETNPVDPRIYLSGGLEYAQIEFAVFDRFDNPVANVPLSFTNSYHAYPQTCPAGEGPTFFEAGQCPARMRFELTEPCGKANAEILSSSHRSHVYVMPPPKSNLRGEVRVTAPGLASRIFKWVDPGSPDATCGRPRYHNYWFRWADLPNGQQVTPGQTTIAAAPAGEWFKRGQRFSYYRVLGDTFTPPVAVTQLVGDCGGFPCTEMFNGEIGGIQLDGNNITLPIKAPEIPGRVIGYTTARAFILPPDFYSDAILPVDGWGVRTFMDVQPPRIPVSVAQTTFSDILLRALIIPYEYTGFEGRMSVTAQGNTVHEVTQPQPKGLLNFPVLRGFRLESSEPHVAKFVLNPGTPFEISTEETPLPLSFGIVSGFSAIPPAPVPEPQAAKSAGVIEGVYNGRVRLETQIDIPRQHVCRKSEVFAFALARAANVELSIDPLDRFGVPTGFPDVLESGDFEVGEHRVQLQTEGIQPGAYRLTLKAIDSAEPTRQEVYLGSLTHDYRVKNARSFGHTSIKGVNTFDGGFSLSREDLKLPGRGPELAMYRNYSSMQGQSSGLGYMGWGWNSILQQTVSAGNCGEVFINGADGGGQAYVFDRHADGVDFYRGLKGVHGALQYHPQEQRWVYFSKDGTRMEFGEFRRNSRTRGARLTAIEDTSGQRQELEYEDLSGDIVLKRVANADGRWLEFDYTEIPVVFTEAAGGDEVPLQLLTKVRASTGDRIDYGYNENGNLGSVRVHRAGLAGFREDYDYQDFGHETYISGGSERAIYHGWKLIRITDPRSGDHQQLNYVREFAEIHDRPEPTRVPQHRVIEFREKDGGRWQFDYLGTRGTVDPQTRMIDPRGNSTTYRMNLYGAVTLLVDPAGSKSTTWDMDRIKPTSSTDRLGHITSWTYDAFGNKLTETISGPGAALSRSWSYASPEQFTPPYIKIAVRTAVDARGTATTNDHDNHGRLIAVTRGGVTERFAYASNGDIVSRTNGAGESIQYGYDSAGRVTGEFAPLNASRSYAYDAQGRRVRATDERGHTTQFRYDGYDRITEIRDPIGVRTITYHADGKGRDETDELRRTVSFREDPMGRVITIQRPLGVTETFQYDLSGNLTQSKDPRGRVTSHTYNGANQRISTSAPEGRVTQYVNDAEGHVIAETTSGAGGTRSVNREYQHALYLTTKVINSGLTAQSQYDGNGNLIESIDPRGGLTAQTFDLRDRLRTRSEPEGRVITWDWDAADRQLSETHNSGWGRVRTYNSLGQPISETDQEGGVWTRVFDTKGNILSQVDRRGGTMSWSYDARSRKLTESGPLPEQNSSFEYDPVNNRIKETLANGRMLVHRYDALNRRIGSSDQLGDIDLLTYDRNGNVLSITDANGEVATYEYNGLNQRIKQIASGNRESLWAYSAWNDVLTETMPEGGRTSHEYDSLGRRLRTIFPLTPSDGNSAPFQSWSYDENGNVLTQTDARGLVTAFTYDGLNRRKTQTDPHPLSFAQSWTYDTDGNVLSHSDRNGVVTTFTYDLEHRRTSTTRADVLRERLEYDLEGGLVARFDGLDRETEFVLDAAGRTIEARMPESIVRSTTYTPLGDVASINDGSDRISTFAYDLRRRKISETNGADETIRYVYDAVGNQRLRAAPKFTGGLPVVPESCTLPGATTHVSLFCYDDAHRLTTVIDSENHKTQYEYDRNDNLTAVIEPLGGRSEFRYDARNRRIEKKSPPVATGPPQTWTWTYDGNSNELLRTDPNGAVSSFTYDALNRRILASFTNIPAGSPSKRDFEFDANGNPTQLSETRAGQAVSLNLEYDSLNRPERITDAQGRIWSQAFDDADQRTELSSTGVPDVRWQYDGAGRVERITVEGAGSFTLGYDGADRNTTISHPNGVRSNHDFDLAGRIQLIEHLRGGGTIARQQYQYDANGNRTQQTETNGAGSITSSFVYDQADRLIRIDEPGKHTVYALDANSNRIETREGASAGTVDVRYVARFDARNQITEQLKYNSGNAVIATTDFDFDANGNLIRQRNGSAVTQYRYDHLDRLIETTPPTGPPTLYLYGPSDVRIAKQRAGQEVRYHYDGERLILETNVLGEPQRHYAYTAAGLLNTAILGSAPQHRSAHLDAQTSPIAVTAANGNVVNRSRFDAFGVETNLFGVRDQAISFQGYWSGVELEETGNLLSAARLYIPGLGVFGERDPVEGSALEPISFNPYLIGRGNPHRWLDKDGRCTLDRELCVIIAAQKMGVDVNSPNGRSKAEEFVAASERQFWNSLGTGAIELGVSVLDVPGVGLEVLGMDTGSTERMTDKVRALRDFSGEPLVAIQEGIDARADAVGEAYGTGNPTAAGELDGSLNAGVVTAVAGALVPGGLTRFDRMLPDAAPDRVPDRSPDPQPDNPPNPPENEGERFTESNIGFVTCCEGPQCFAAGTLVATALGLKPIEEVGVGEMVVARDEQTLDDSLKPVTVIFVRPDREIAELVFASYSGDEQRLDVTLDHRFHSVERGWITAGAIRVGEAIDTLNGDRFTLKSRSEGVTLGTTYNFTVDKHHNYFVSEVGLWVHNTDSKSCVPCNGSSPPALSEIDPGVRFYAGPDGVLDTNDFARNSGFRKGVRDDTWNEAIEESTGRVRDPQTGRFLSAVKKWDMGHRPKMEYWKERAHSVIKWLYERVKVSRKDFLDRMNDSKRYRPELPSSNRNHRSESKTEEFEE